MRHSIAVAIMLITLAGPALAGDGQIDIATIPYEITESGSYVVVADLTLTATDTHGIRINANNVTIDLNGHALIGPGKATGGWGNGISTSSQSNIAVFNGVIHDFRGSGISIGGSSHQVWQVRAYNNGGDGILLGGNGTVFDCTAVYNGDDGIVTGLGAVVRDNCARSNDGDGIVAEAGSTVIGNASSRNGGDGIRAGEGSFPYSDGATVAMNACIDNTGNGIEAVDSLVAENTCVGNTGNLNLTSCTPVNNHAP